MTKPWRCYAEECAEDPHGRLGFDFEAEHPVCPKCGADGRKPEGADLVIKLEVLHYIVKDKQGPIVTSKGRRRIVCRPTAILSGPRCTAQASEATCKACKATPEYLAAMAEQDEFGPVSVPAGKDFAVELVSETMELRKAD